MTSNWNGIVIGVCLVLLQQGIGALFMYPSCTLYEASPSRVVNGTTASPGSAPFMAYVMNNNEYICGGSIINERYILTAAHCLMNAMTVRLGEHDDRTNPDCEGRICIPKHEDFFVESYVVHGQYDNVTQANDIAVLRLNRNIHFAIHIQPICLYSFPERGPMIRDYTVSGWGQTSAHGSMSHVLQTTKLRRLHISNCGTPFKTLTSRQLCAGSTTSDTCGGDSGSPLVAEITTSGGVQLFVQLGIVSFGVGHCRGIGAYTYVPSYGSWILGAM